MPFRILRADITRLQVDAIVNAANTQLAQGGGVCGAIFSAAGEAQMRAACEPLSPIRTGEAVMTPGFRLPARYVIHTSGPVWQGGHQGEDALLKRSYISSMQLAVDSGLQTIAFPLLSSGIYGYPKDRALEVALAAIGSFLMQHELDVTLVVFSKEAFQLSQGLHDAVASYVSDYYVEAMELSERRRPRIEPSFSRDAARRPSLKDWAGRRPSAQPWQQDDLPAYAPATSPVDAIEELPRGETFTEMLLRIIRERDLQEPEVYKRANLDRRAFHKIRSNKHHQPTRKTVLALAVALRLSRAEADELMACAGFALSKGNLFDIIIAFFLDTRQYDIFEINSVLFHYEQDILA